MAETDTISDDHLQPNNCISYRLRRAARMAAKYYDNALKPCGLRNTQFTLVAALQRLGEISIGDLSLKLATDGTTLNRNLEVLVRRGFVENNPAEDGRIRNVKLTPLGHQTFDEALPLWQDAQQKLLRTLDSEPWEGMAAQLGLIEEACTD